MATIKGTYTWETATINSQNATVGFKLGLEKDLTSSSLTGQNGVFYLTSDTHRLYIGNSDGTISPVNQGVITVPSLPDYSNAIPGQFYYINGKNENILAVYNGVDWFQVNPDTQVDTVETTVTQGTTAIKDTNSNVAIQTTVNQLGGSHTKTTVTSNEVTFAGANDILITTKNNVITITDADYSFSATTTKDDNNEDVASSVDFNLDRKPAGSDKKDVESKVTFVGTNGVAVTQNNKGTITIDASEAMNQAASDSITGVDFEALDQGFGLTLTKGIGFIYSDTDLDPIISVGAANKDVPNTTVHFNSGTAALPVYTIAEVDTKISNALKGLNALTYKGLVDGYDKLPTIAGGVAVGDVYMSNGSDGDYDSGTLFIATGKEDLVTGLITSNLEWTIVDNYNTDTQTQVNLGVDYTLGLSNKAGDSETDLGSYKVVTLRETLTDEEEKKVYPLSASDATTTAADGSKHKTVVINHTVAGYKHTNAEASSGTTHNVLFSSNQLLSSIGVDDWGHVKTSENILIEVPTEIFAEPDEDVPVDYTVEASVSVDATKDATNRDVYTATFTSKQALAESSMGNLVSAMENSHKIISKSLELEANEAGGMNINLVWGTF